DDEEREFAEDRAREPAGGLPAEHIGDPPAARHIQETEADVIQLARFTGEVARECVEDFGAASVSSVSVDPSQLIKSPLARGCRLLLPVAKPKCAERPRVVKTRRRIGPEPMGKRNPNVAFPKNVSRRKD